LAKLIYRNDERGRAKREYIKQMKKEESKRRR
jgi:hypothetical protein